MSSLAVVGRGDFDDMLASSRRDDESLEQLENHLGNGTNNSVCILDGRTTNGSPVPVAASCRGYSPGNKLEINGNHDRAAFPATSCGSVPVVTHVKTIDGGLSAQHTSTGDNESLKDWVKADESFADELVKEPWVEEDDATVNQCPEVHTYNCVNGKEGGGGGEHEVERTPVEGVPSGDADVVKVECGGMGAAEGDNAYNGQQGEGPHQLNVMILEQKEEIRSLQRTVDVITQQLQCENSKARDLEHQSASFRAQTVELERELSTVKQQYNEVNEKLAAALGDHQNMCKEVELLRSDRSHVEEMEAQEKVLQSLQRELEVVKAASCCREAEYLALGESKEALEKEQALAQTLLESAKAKSSELEGRAVAAEGQRDVLDGKVKELKEEVATLKSADRRLQGKISFMDMQLSDQLAQSAISKEELADAQNHLKTLEAGWQAEYSSYMESKAGVEDKLRDARREITNMRRVMDESIQLAKSADHKMKGLEKRRDEALSKTAETQKLLDAAREKLTNQKQANRAEVKLREELVVLRRRQFEFLGIAGPPGVYALMLIIVVVTFFLTRFLGC